MPTQEDIVIRQNSNINKHNKIVTNLNNTPLLCPIFKSLIEKKKSSINANKNNMIGNKKLLQYSSLVVVLNIERS